MNVKNRKINDNINNRPEDFSDVLKSNYWMESEDIMAVALCRQFKLYNIHHIPLRPISLSLPQKKDWDVLFRKNDDIIRKDLSQEAWTDYDTFFEQRKTDAWNKLHQEYRNDWNNLFQEKLLFNEPFSFFVHVNGNHWTALVIKPDPIKKQHVAYYKDSKDSREGCIPQWLVQDLHHYNIHNIQSFKGKEQQDSTSCGFFVLENIKHMCNAIKDNQSIADETSKKHFHYGKENQNANFSVVKPASGFQFEPWSNFKYTKVDVQRANIEYYTKSALESVIYNLSVDNRFKQLTTADILSVFNEAELHKGYTNNPQKTTLSTSNDVKTHVKRAFSVAFQSECANVGVMSPVNNKVGLRTKRMLEQFGGNKQEMEDFVRSNWKKR